MRSTLLDEPGEFRGVVAMRDEIFRLAALEPVGDVGLALSCGIAGIKMRPSFIAASIVAHSSGHHAQHHQEPVAALGAQGAKADGQARGLLRKRSPAKLLVSTRSPMTVSASPSQAPALRLRARRRTSPAPS